MQRKKCRKLFLYLSKNYSFRNLPIVTKLLMAFSFVFISLIMLSLITYVKYKDDKEASTLSIIQHMDIQSLEKIDDYLNNMKSATKMPLFTENLESDFIKELKNFNTLNVRSLMLQKLSEQISNRIMNTQPSVHSVFFFNLDGMSEYKIVGKSLYKDFNPKEQAWFQTSIDLFGKPLVLPTYELPNLADSTNKSARVFSVTRAIVDVNSYDVVGVMLINTRLDYISNIYKKIIMYPDQRIILIDKSGYTIYDTEEKAITKQIDTELLEAVKQMKPGTNDLNYNDVIYMADHMSSSSSGWQMINLIPKNQLNKNILQIKNTTIFTTIILIVIVSLFLFLISGQIVRPLKKLVQLMKLIEKGNLDVRLNFQNRDEVGQLARTFNRMTGQIRNLANEIYKDKIKQKELEIQMLQTQINPHFLYNALESIHMMSEINKDNETSEMSRVLGKILRYGISKNNAIVTVSQEINHLQDYIFLEKVRFDELFHIIINVEEAILDKKVIKLILQPLVENAIYHGLSSREAGGMIEISGYKTEKNIIFEIVDNGLGIDSITVQMLNNYIYDLNNSFSSIGLKNVHKRIQLHYGIDYGIQIFSELGSGTRIVVKLPSEEA